MQICDPAQSKPSLAGLSEGSNIPHLTVHYDSDDPGEVDDPCTIIALHLDRDKGIKIVEDMNKSMEELYQEPN